MYTGNVFGITLIILGVLITLACFQLLVTALLPNVVNGSKKTVSKHPFVSLFVGVLTVGFTVIVFGGLQALGEFGQFLGALFLSAVIVLAICGLAGLSRLVGERMPSSIDAVSPWRPTLRGAVTSELAFTAPILGWFAFGVAIICCSGAGVIASVGTTFKRLFRRGETAAEITAATPPPPVAATADESAA